MNALSRFAAHLRARIRRWLARGYDIPAIHGPIDAAAQRRAVDHWRRQHAPQSRSKTRVARRQTP